MSYPECGMFDFHRLGNAHRRDPNAQPRVLLLGFNPDRDRALLHVAGSPHLLSAHVLDAGVDDALIAAMAPNDALRLGVAHQREKTNSDPS